MHVITPPKNKIEDKSLDNARRFVQELFSDDKIKAKTSRGESMVGKIEQWLPPRGSPTRADVGTEQRNRIVFDPFDVFSYIVPLVGLLYLAGLIYVVMLTFSHVAKAAPSDPKRARLITRNLTEDHKTTIRKFAASNEWTQATTSLLERVAESQQIILLQNLPDAFSEIGIELIRSPVEDAKLTP
jgi:hypothetical protein